MMNVPDLLRLRAALAALFPRPAEVRRVLDVGCGALPAAGAVRAIFPSAVLFGLDCDLNTLRAEPGRRLVAADAAMMPFARHTCFDLILVRHPDVARHLERWRQAGVILPRYLSPRGRLLVSCYEGYEMEAIRAALIAGGAVPLRARLGLVPVDLAGRDRWMLGFAGSAAV